jgi:hypothetical protein
MPLSARISTVTVASFQTGSGTLSSPFFQRFTTRSTEPSPPAVFHSKPVEPQTA